MNGVVDGDCKSAGYDIKRVCLSAGMSRQNYYAARRLRKRREIDEAMLIELVKRERRMQPRLGGRKVLYLIDADLHEAGIEIGRDRFFELLAEQDLLVKPKRKRPHTTNSRHSLPVFHNLVTGNDFDSPNQVWVSDITYIRTDEGFLYAALITDKVSRKIVGAHIGDNLEAEGCLKALDQALSDLPGDKHPIHHSDRGCQYCCHEYVNRLKAHGLEISMTEVMHCYENSQAERVNGILKGEYNLDQRFRSKAQARKAFEQSVWLYNHCRPHTELNMCFPANVHAEAA